MSEELTERRIMKIQYDVNSELRNALFDIQKIANEYAELSATKGWRTNAAIEKIAKRSKKALDFLDCKGALLDDLKKKKVPKNQGRLANFSDPPEE